VNLLRFGGNLVYWERPEGGQKVRNRTAEGKRGNCLKGGRKRPSQRYLSKKGFAWEKRQLTGEDGCHPSGTIGFGVMSRQSERQS